MQQANNARPVPLPPSPASRQAVPLKLVQPAALPLPGATPRAWVPPPAAVVPLPQAAAPVSQPKVATASREMSVRWWAQVFQGLAWRVMDVLPQVLAPVLFLLRHAITLLRSAWLLALPAAATWACYRYVPGLAEHYPWVSPKGMAYAAGLYTASAFVLLLGWLGTCRLARDLRRTLGDLAAYGSGRAPQAPRA